MALLSLLPPCGAGHTQEAPVLAYRLDEGEGGTARDGAGRHPGAIAAPTWVHNSTRAALRFDGRETVLTVDGGDDMAFPAGFTIAVWFQAAATAPPGPLGLIVKSPTFRLLAYPLEGKFLIDIGGERGERIYETVAAAVSAGAWHHVALAYASGVGATLYLDGEPAYQTDQDIGAPVAGSAPLRIGLGADPEQRRYFVGLMANAAVWDRALSAREVQAVVAQQSPELRATFRGPDDLVPDKETKVLHDIGDRKQLFIDTRFIESSRGVALTMNPPDKLGVVMLPDRPWETLRIGFCDAVMEYEGKFRFYYNAMARGKGTFLCLATSEDGVHWEKPNLGVCEFEGSKDNNIVMAASGESVPFLDPHGSPEQRFKCISVGYWPDPEKAGLYVHTSPDGVHWTRGTERLFPLCPDTANMAMWDAQRGKYVAHIRIWNPLRKVGRVEMDDILQPWPYTPLEQPFYIWGKDKVAVPSREVPTCFGYDEQDPVPLDHYNSAAVEYPWAEAAYLMFPAAYLHFPEPPVGKYGNDGLLDIQLAVSRDGVEYKRLSREPYIPLSFGDAKDSKCLYMATGMVRRGEWLYQYYAGFEVTHGEPEEAGPDPVASICAVRQRLDGFISADADYAGGELLTPPVRFAGGRLELNINCSALGACRVELLDEAGSAVPGYELAACDEIHGNHTAKTVTWQGKSDVSSLAGQTIRLRFALRACKLYALRFSA